MIKKRTPRKGRETRKVSNGTMLRKRTDIASANILKINAHFEDLDLKLLINSSSIFSLENAIKDNPKITNSNNIVPVKSRKLCT
jgi:hypothetical protein